MADWTPQTMGRKGGMAGQGERKRRYCKRRGCGHVGHFTGQCSLCPCYIEPKPRPSVHEADGTGDDLRTRG